MTAVNTRSSLHELFGFPVPSTWEQLVEPDPLRPGDDRVRLTDHGIAVWAVIGHLRALGPEFSRETIAQAAEDFRVPVTAITTAIAYYLRHQAPIESRLAINAAAVS